MDPNMMNNMMEMMKDPNMMKSVESMMAKPEIQNMLNNPDMMSNMMNMFNMNMPNLDDLKQSTEALNNTNDDTENTNDNTNDDTETSIQHKFLENTSVILVGLKCKTYNNLKATVLGFNETSNRYRVRISSPSEEVVSNKEILVKEENLTEETSELID